MKRFEYFEPSTLPKPSRCWRATQGRAQPLAGGTDLLVELKEQLRRADCVVNIKRIPGIDRLRFDARDGLRIGALVTAREIELSPFVRRNTMLRWSQAARELGSIQVRNRATIVGNVCRASPSADTLPPLIADGARPESTASNGERSVPLEEFFTGPGKTVLEPGRAGHRDRGAGAAAAHRQGLHQARPAQGDGACHRRRGGHLARANGGRAHRARRGRADADPRAQGRGDALRGKKLDARADRRGGAGGRGRVRGRSATCARAPTTAARWCAC